MRREVRGMRGWALPMGFLVALGGYGCGPTDGASVRAEARLSLSDALSGADTAGYSRALDVRPFVFPEDHGPHPDFRTEWWYLTGNLSTADDRWFGFQFTIFRSALAPEPPESSSAWATNQAYMGHFTLTDVGAGTFREHERFARGAGGLAGARIEPDFEVWLDDWRLTGSGGASTFPLRVEAAGDEVALSLTMREGKPVVFQGDRGLSQKGPEPGNASYYYAHTRLPASGSVVVQGDTLEVSGLAWMDREWSTSALSGDQVGWDWFSLQLDDGWEVMVYRLRLADGQPDPLSDGVLIDPNGVKIPLEWEAEIELEETGSWTSPIDGAVYPSGWRLRVPERGIDLSVEPVLDDQELDLAFRYWEGAVRVEGTGADGPVSGRGYVELTGYAEAPRER